MKRIIFILLIIISGTSIFSCKKMLDIDNDGRLNYGDIFGDIVRTRQYYNSLFNAYTPGQVFGGTFLAAYTDEAQSVNDRGNYSPAWYYQGRLSASNYGLLSGDRWSNNYYYIRRCHTFMESLNNPEIATYPYNEEEKAGWIAHARVQIAFCYLDLMKWFGAVPLVKNSYDQDHDYSKDYRAPVHEVVDYIIGQCDTALATPMAMESRTAGFRWTPPSDNLNVPTRALAWAIKSRASLYAASPLHYVAGESKYDWAYVTQITKEALDQCLDNDYELYTGSPSDAQNGYEYYMFTQADGNRSTDKETILAGRSRLSMWNNNGVPITEGMNSAGTTPTQEMVDAYETTDGQPILILSEPYLNADHTRPNLNPASIYDEDDPYENRDPRFYASIWYNGVKRWLRDIGAGTDPNITVDTYVGGNSEISEVANNQTNTRTGYYLRKFTNWQSRSGSNLDGFMRAFRLAELYLNFAEAAYNSVGPDVDVPSVVTGMPAMSARQAVNKVRSRVNMPDLPSGMSKADFELRYRNERRIEFAFEEHRYFDVRRWKILEQTDHYVTGMRITKNNDDSFNYQRFTLSPERQTYTEKYLLYPVPREEVLKMYRYTGDDWQNPGW